eukprot:843497-Amphidinium_carterae.1
MFGCLQHGAYFLSSSGPSGLDPAVMRVLLQHAFDKRMAPSPACELAWLPLALYITLSVHSRSRSRLLFHCLSQLYDAEISQVLPHTDGVQPPLGGCMFTPGATDATRA